MNLEVLEAGMLVECSSRKDKRGNRQDLRELEE